MSLNRRQLIKRASGLITLAAPALILPSRPALAAITFGTPASNGFASSAASLSVTVTATSAGDAVAVMGMYDRTTAATFAITTNGGQASQTPNISFDEGIFFKAFSAFFPAAPTGTTSIGIAFTGTNPAFCSMWAWTIHGMTSPVVDQVNHATGSSAAPDSGATGALAASGNPLVSFTTSAAGLATAAGSGWTFDGLDSANDTGGAHQLSPSTASIDGSFTISSVSTWLCMVAAYKNTAGGTTLPGALRPGPFVGVH